MPLTARVSVAYALCSVVQRCLDLITLPFFTRILTTEQFGQTTIYSSWSSILVIFLTLQLPYGSFSRAMVKYEDRRDEYIASVEGICLLISFIFLCIYIPLNGVLGALFELPMPIMIVMVFEILGKTAIALWSGKKRFEFRYKEVIALTIAISVLSVSCQFILVRISTEKGYARIAGSATVSIVFGGILYIRSAVRGKRIYNRELWKYALGFNIPLLIYYLSQMIFNHSDRIMISHISGKDKAAVYGVAYSVAIMLTFVLDAINNAYSPWFYLKLKERGQSVNRPIANAIAVLMGILFAGIIWVAPEVILLLGGEEYAQAKWIVAPVAVSMLLLFYSQLFIYYEFFFEKKRSLGASSVGAAILNIVLNALLIPRFVYYAAGYTTLFSYLLFAAANYLSMRRITKEEQITDDGIDIRTLIVILMVVIVTGSMGMLLYDFMIVRFTIILIAFAILLFNRKRIIKFYFSIKDRMKA